ncbi:Tol-Pal system beta propeller repeat protein TolB [Devosia sp. CN2-171]|uniref:Tol-Pal system beta propeller repeat protein TolB n=1 Tax=Devosia sp. CN2-171 TaxID=3400909 RepID=UPI003BF872E8
MPLITRRNALKLGVAGGAFALATPSQALVEIVVTGGNFTPLPIAIPDFASSDPTFGAEIAEIVRNNLRRSGLFVPMDPATLPVRVGDVQNEPDFATWRAATVDALVMGSVERGAEVSSQVRVWDTQASAQVVGKSYKTDAQNYRRIAHIVSDAIYASLSGGSGYFDTRILYVAESGPKANRVKRLAIMDQDGFNVQYLSSGKALTLTPRLSPNGDNVVYTSYEDGNPQVYLSGLGGASKKLIDNAPMSFAPRFAPDGSTVVFSVSNGGATNIYTAGVGGGYQQLTEGQAIDTSPCYSPDGSRIAFESDRGGSPQLYVMGAAGGGAQRISYGEGTYSTPVWSPDGTLIAFTRQSAGQFHIGTMKPDGSGERILSSSGQVQEGPTWAPNSRVIAFFREPGGDAGPGLWSIDIWGRNEQSLTTESFASDPSWSPLRG